MSLRSKQYSALKKSRDFLQELMRIRVKDIRKKWLVDQAYSCLRHFPFLYANGQPIWSSDDLTEDVVEKCKYTSGSNPDMVYYESSCGDVLDFMRDYKYCPYCGKLIEVCNDERTD